MTLPSFPAADSRQHFDEVASTWVDRYRSAPSFRTRLRLVSRAAGNLLGGGGAQARVLDLGSGPGVLGMAVSAWASLVVCADTSHAMLRAGQMAESSVEEVLDAMGLGHRREVIVRVAGSTASLAGASRRPFDLVLAVSVLEYQSDPRNLLVDIVRLVRPGGSILFTVPNGRSLVRRVERPADRFAALTGRALGVARLADRSYSSKRPFGSDVPWIDALGASGAVCREIIPLPLGDTGVRARLSPNLLVVAEAR